MDAEYLAAQQRMMAAYEGLREIAAQFSRYIDFRDEDPLTFGGGHYVLYPSDDNDRRFAVEEQYADAEDDDPDRVPTSWTWSDETHLPADRPGTMYWQVHAEGEVASVDYPDLLTQARAWAQTIRAEARRADSAAVFTEPVRRLGESPPGLGR